MIASFPRLIAGLLGVAIAGIAFPLQAASDSNIQHPENLPPVQSSQDPVPPAPSPLADNHIMVVKQAGIGSPVSYARNGVLELGGNLNFVHHTDFTQLSVSPSIGWFFTDNFELSALVSVAFDRTSAKDSDVVTNSTFVTALVEPSVHVPILDNLFIFGGWGFGVAYSQASERAGFAMQPRLGLNILVGRSGILSPSASWNWSSNELVQLSDGRGTAVAVNSTWGANIGYTVMW